MGDEPSNAASEYQRAVLSFFNESGAPTEELVRAALADDFTLRDLRSGPSLPDADAESYPQMVLSWWETGSGRPRWDFHVVAVRGGRFVAMALRVDYGDGMITEGIQITALDVAGRRVQCVVNFDTDDTDRAIAELDRLYEASLSEADDPL